MAQRIVTECDECMTTEERRAARTYRLQALGVAVELDLCEEHVKPLQDLVEHYDNLGRRVAETVKRAPVVCPHCGKALKTPDSLAKHIKRVHPEHAPARTSSGSHTCPECGQTFDTPQGRGAHRNRAHGVKAVHPR